MPQALIYCIILAFIFSGFVFVKNADAYLFISSGSYLTQVIIAAVVFGLFGIKLFWGKIKVFLLKIFKKKV